MSFRKHRRKGRKKHARSRLRSLALTRNHNDKNTFDFCFYLTVIFPLYLYCIFWGIGKMIPNSLSNIFISNTHNPPNNMNHDEAKERDNNKYSVDWKYCKQPHSCSGVVKLNQYPLSCIGDSSCIGITNSYFNDLHCVGSFSCAFAQNIIVKNELSCHGALSCINSTISVHSGAAVLGEGSFALANAVIYVTSKMGGIDNNSYSYNYNFKNNDDGHVEISLKGYFAGYNLSIYCDVTNQDVTVTCQENACVNTTIRTLTNTFDDIGIIPHIYDRMAYFIHLLTFKRLSYKPLTRQSDITIKCFSLDDYYCIQGADNIGWSHTIHSLRNNVEHMYNSTFNRSMKKVGEIQSEYYHFYNILIDKMDTCQLINDQYSKYSATSKNVYYSESNGALIKRIDDVANDGFSTQFGKTIQIKTSITINGEMTCGSNISIDLQSLMNSFHINVDRDSNQNHDRWTETSKYRKYNYICARASDAIYQQTINFDWTKQNMASIAGMNYNNVICGGVASCQSHFINHDHNSLNAYGYNYSNSNLISHTNQYKSIYCLGTMSCSAVITNFNSNSNSIIQYSSTTVRFENIDNVYCGGYTTCAGIQMVNPSKVYFLTNRLLRDSHHGKIDEDVKATIRVTNGSRSTMFFNSYGSGAHVNIICEFGSICTIYCQTLLSCIREVTLLQCDGNCQVYCHTDDEFEFNHNETISNETHNSSYNYNYNNTYCPGMVWNSSKSSNTLNLTPGREDDDHINITITSIGFDGVLPINKTSSYGRALTASYTKIIQDIKQHAFSAAFSTFISMVIFPVLKLAIAMKIASPIQLFCAKILCVWIVIDFVFICIYTWIFMTVFATHWTTMNAFIHASVLCAVKTCWRMMMSIGYREWIEEQLSTVNAIDERINTSKCYISAQSISKNNLNSHTSINQKSIGFSQTTSMIPSLNIDVSRFNSYVSPVLVSKLFLMEKELKNYRRMLGLVCGNENCLSPKYLFLTHGSDSISHRWRSKKANKEKIRKGNMHIQRNGKFYKCKGCKRVLYCSRKCQKQDWNLNGHKYTCTLSMCLHQSNREWRRVIRESKCYS